MTIEEVNNIEEFFKIGPKDSNYLIFSCSSKDFRKVYGLFDYSSGEVIIKPELYDIEISLDNMTFVALNSNALYSLYNYDGIRLSLNYEYISEEHEGYRIVKNNGKYGVINNQGELVLPFGYVNIFLPSEGMVIVNDSKNGYLYYDIEKKKFIPCKYGVPKPFCGGYSLQIDEDGNSAFVDKEGENAYFHVKSQFKKSFVKNKYTDTFVVYATDEHGMIEVYDNNGNILISGYSPNKYELENTGYDVDVVWSRITELFGVVNYNNELIIPINYITIEVLSNGIIKCTKIPFISVDYYDLEGNKLPLENVSFKNDKNNTSEYILGSVLIDKETEEYKLAFYDRHGNIAFNELTFDEGENFKNHRAMIINYQVDYRANNPIEYKKYTVINDDGKVLFTYPKKETDEYLEKLEEKDNVYLGKIINKDEYIIISKYGFELERFKSKVIPVISHGLVKYSSDGISYTISKLSGQELISLDCSNIKIINSRCFTAINSDSKRLFVIKYDQEHNNYYLNHYDISREHEQEKNTFVKRLSKIIRR